MWSVALRPVAGFLARRLTGKALAHQAGRSAAGYAYGNAPHSQQPARPGRADQVQVSQEATRPQQPTPSVPNFGQWNVP